MIIPNWLNFIQQRKTPLKYAFEKNCLPTMIPLVENGAECSCDKLLGIVSTHSIWLHLFRYSSYWFLWSLTRCKTKLNNKHNSCQGHPNVFSYLGTLLYVWDKLKPFCLTLIICHWIPNWCVCFLCEIVEFCFVYYIIYIIWYMFCYEMYVISKGTSQHSHCLLPCCYRR